MMAVDANDEDAILASAAKSFFDKAGGVARFRRLRDEGESLDEKTWTSMVSLGWSAITVPHEYGGSGCGFTAALPILEAMGRTLTPEPILSALFAAELLRFSDNVDSQKVWLPPIASGDVRLAVAGAQQRRARFPGHNRLCVRPTTSGVEIDGQADFVLDAATAGGLVVLGEGDGASAVVVIELPMDGVSIDRCHLMDSRGWATVRCDRVRVPRNALLDADGRADWVESAIDRATLGHCCETLGAMWEAFDRTVNYTMSRVQFGRAIASFQAVQHRLARLYTEILMADAAIHGAAKALERADPNIPALVSAAKVCSDIAARSVGRESVQLHGGIGVTDECDVGLFLKRVRVSEFLFGDRAWHADRWANQQDY